MNVGVLYAIIAFLAWGAMPAYWRLLKAVPSTELLSHRVVWSLLFVACLLAYRRRLPEIIGVCRRPRVLAMLMLSSLLVGANWLIFIWAVNNGHVLESSLGYFINPLMSVLLGAVVLKEHLGRAQRAAVALATFGVVLFASQGDGIPWIALGVALTFSLYGLIRKTVAVDSLLGLSVETVLLTPLALAYLLYLEANGTGAFLHQGASIDRLLVLGGVVTALPLLWFAHAAKRLRLSTLGVLNYITPTGQFALAVFAYDEALTPKRLLAFACIWSGLAIYSTTTWMSAKRLKTLPV